MACFAMSSAYSQAPSDDRTSTVDPRIQEVFGDQIQTLVFNVPNRIKDLNDILNNRVKIEELKFDKTEKFQKLSSVELFNRYNPSLVRDSKIDENNFNPLKYDLNFHARTLIIYRIDNTDKIIAIYPQTVLKGK